MEKQIEEIAKVICEDCAGSGTPCREPMCDAVLQNAKALYNAGYRKIPDNIGEFSDGYHTFNELYHHRAVLFSVICNMFPEKAWKSKKHDTGDMYEGMFIVGIETEQGQATYHYDIEPYWDIFKVKELEYAPKYDGHTPSNAISRIGNISIEGYRKQVWISVDDRLPDKGQEVLAYRGDFNGDMMNTYTYLGRGNWEDDYGYRGTSEHEGITHWMPLPEPPKGE